MRFGSELVTALDIQDRYMKCIQMRCSFHSWHIQRTAAKEIPPLEDEDIYPYSHIANAIRSLLQGMGIYPPRNLVTCIGGKDAAVRLLNLPPVDDRHMEKLEGMVRYELMMHLPMNVEQMSYDYHVTNRNSDGTTVLTVAAKRSVIERHLKLLSLAGISPDVVTTSSLALLNAFVQREPETIMAGRIGLVCLRDASGDMIVCENGELTYTRSFTFQNNAGKEQLIREMRRSFDTYTRSRSEGNGDIERVLVMTEDGELPPGLTEEDISGTAPDASWHVYPVGDDLSLGLALAAARTCPNPLSGMLIRLNLRRQIAQEERVARKKTLRTRLAQVLPAIVIPILMAISGTLWWQAHEVGEKLHSVKQAQEASRQRTDSIKQLNNTEEELQKQIAFLNWSTESYPMVSYRLYQISQIIPDNLWLKEVYIPEQKISRKRKNTVPQAISKLCVVGYAHRQEQIEEFLSVLRGCDCFSDVKQESTSEVRVSGERVLEFQVGLISQPGKTGMQLSKVGDGG